MTDLFTGVEVGPFIVFGIVLVAALVPVALRVTAAFDVHDKIVACFAAVWFALTIAMMIATPSVRYEFAESPYIALTLVFGAAGITVFAGAAAALVMLVVRKLQSAP